MTHLFVIPDVAAMISGGNLYNASLISALRDHGTSVTVCDLAAAQRGGAGDAPTCRWIDSLYLDALPRLRGAGGRTNLLVHYLPSLVERGRIPSPAELTAVEREALAAADGFLVPSEFMKRTLHELGAGSRPVVVLAPGIDVSLDPLPMIDRRELHALLVGNVVPGKRVLPLLEALRSRLQAGLPIELTVAGSLTMDRDYARACQALGVDVRFTGALPRHELLARLAASDVLVSPSCMESFGLALAEARALGVPIIARAGGNSAAHLDAQAGGALVHSDEEMAGECERLALDRTERARRQTAARARRPPARSWSEAAREFVAAQRAATSE